MHDRRVDAASRPEAVDSSTVGLALRGGALHVRLMQPPRTGLCAALVLGAALALPACDQRGEPPRQEAAILGVQEAADRFAGIPQQGIALGRPDAPVTLVEFVDLQCGHCADFALEVLPEIVERHVRTGQVRIELRTLAFLGEGSVRAARMAGAAALQDRMWQLVDLLFHNQRAGTIERVTEGSLRRLAEALPGLDAQRAVDQRNAPAVDRWLAEAEEQARHYEIEGTPSFLIGRTGGELRALELEARTPEAFSQAIEAQLRAGG